MQIKTIIRYYRNSTRLSKIKNTLTMPSAGKDVKRLELSYVAGGNVICESLWKTVCPFLKKLT